RVGKGDVLQRLPVGDLVRQRPVVTFEHRDEQGQREERVGTQLEEPHVVPTDEYVALLVGEGQPGRPLAGVAVEDRVGHLLLPPRDRAGRGIAVALDELGIAVDGVEELVQQVLAHRRLPSGYQVKYASIVWN